jgi:hypothetical protein
MNNEYINRILKNTVEGDYIFLSCIDRREGKNNRFWPNYTNDGKHTSLGLLKKVGWCNYISLNTYIDKNRTRNNISNLNGFMLDFDDGDIKELVERVEQTFGSATWKITTTPSKGKTQLIYLFKEPELRTDLWEKVSLTFTMFAGSDSQTWDLSRVFRHPESVNGKNGEQTLIEKTVAEYSLDYFVDKLSDNNIELLSPEDTKSPTSTKSSNTQKKERRNKKTAEDINKENNYYSQYQKFELEKPSPSEARYSFIFSLIKKRMNDAAILKVCDELGLDMYDCNKIVLKIRTGYKRRG